MLRTLRPTVVAISGSKSRTAALMPQNLSALKPHPYKGQLFRKPGYGLQVSGIRKDFPDGW